MAEQRQHLAQGRTRRKYRGGGGGGGHHQRDMSEHGCVRVWPDARAHSNWVVHIGRRFSSALVAAVPRQHASAAAVPAVSTAPCATARRHASLSLLWQMGTAVATQSSSSSSSSSERGGGGGGSSSSGSKQRQQAAAASSGSKQRQQAAAAARRLSLKGGCVVDSKGVIDTKNKKAKRRAKGFEKGRVTFWWRIRRAAAELLFGFTNCRGCLVRGVRGLSENSEKKGCHQPLLMTVGHMSQSVTHRCAFERTKGC